MCLSRFAFRYTATLYSREAPGEKGGTEDEYKMAQNLLTIGFDADDTLWHNERFFVGTQEKFADLLKDHAERAHLEFRRISATV